MSQLQPIVLEALKVLTGKLRAKGLPSVEWMAEFNGLVEEARKIEDLGQVEALGKRVLEIENRINMSRVPASEVPPGQRRPTPRIMG